MGGRYVRAPPFRMSDGKLRAEKVTLTEATKMKGEIYYETPKIEPGALFEGSVSCLKERI